MNREVLNELDAQRLQGLLRHIVVGLHPHQSLRLEQALIRCAQTRPRSPHVPRAIIMEKSCQTQTAMLLQQGLFELVISLGNKSAEAQRLAITDNALAFEQAL